MAYFQIFKNIEHIIYMRNENVTPTNLLNLDFYEIYLFINTNISNQKCRHSLVACRIQKNSSLKYLNQSCNYIFFNCQVADVLTKNYALPPEKSFSICKKYLENFRKCPDNYPMDLDCWRQQLWAAALGDNLEYLAGKE